jgi:N-acetylmuramic acid 6-phosphate etherase
MFKNSTESSSKYNNLELSSTFDLLQNLNKEDQTVPYAVAKSLPQINTLLDALIPKIENGGRLFYMGAGTSGRLGILDASECPPTYGIPDDIVIGIIAGGDYAIRHAVENAEDNLNQAIIDLQNFQLNENDFVIGIAASGTTPYVLSGLKYASSIGATTGCIVCNEGSPIAEAAFYPIEVIVGPEFVTGSTRMKAGTAQKLVLNMISTVLMIRLGRVKDNKMVDMKLSNSKLVNRAITMIINELEIDEASAKKLLAIHGSVRKAIEAEKNTKK